MTTKNPVIIHQPSKTDLLFEIIGLQTARGRVLFFGIVSICVYLLPVNTLKNFSLWNLLDIHSPSIGLTRAYHYVLHGDFAKAWEQNDFIFVVLIVGIPIIVKDVYNVTQQIIIGRYFS